MVPADLRCAKLVVLGALFDCLEPCLTIASILAVRVPFVSPRDKREEADAAKASFATQHGDLLLALAAYNEYIDLSSEAPFRRVQSWCGEHFLSMIWNLHWHSNLTAFMKGWKQVLSQVVLCLTWARSKWIALPIVEYLIETPFTSDLSRNLRGTLCIWRKLWNCILYCRTNVELYTGITIKTLPVLFARGSHFVLPYFHEHLCIT